MIHLTIPLDPRTKKNSQNIFVNQKTGNRFISTSKAYKEYVNDCFFLFRETDEALKFPIDKPVNICAVFYMASRRKVDLSNLLSCLDDILVAYGVIVDDNCTIVVGHDGSCVSYCKDDPRTEIFITESMQNVSMTPERKKLKEKME